MNRSHFNNPDHSLIGLEGFSHVWLLWVFHADSGVAIKAKVAPPRLGGTRVGVFSTRSPHRPANIGLTLAKVEEVKGDTVTLSGIDLIDETPVLDIKPYIPAYDSVDRSLEDLAEEEKVEDEAEVETTDQQAGELLQRLQAGEEGLKVRPVGKAEHRENLLDFVNWATGGSNKKTVDDFKQPICGVQDSEKGELFKDAATAVSNNANEKNYHEVYVPEWIANPEADLRVAFSSRAEQDLEKIDLSSCKDTRNCQG